MLDMEEGERHPSEREAKILADLLKIPLNYLNFILAREFYPVDFKKDLELNAIADMADNFFQELLTMPTEVKK